MTPATVADVVARMEEIVAGCPPQDGVAAFTRLYLEVTRGVEDELGRATFADPAFLARLDVIFAGLYFDALSAHERDAATAPRAWAPLFGARARRGIAPLQFAFAGMNAHINRDLPVALVRAWEELGIDPKQARPQHDDYQQVNLLLAAVEERVKRAYLTGVLALISRLLHRFRRIDSVIAMWNVEQARNAAWVNGLTLWSLRHDTRLSGEYLATLDRTVGFAGRGLLVPADTVLARIARRLRSLG